MSSFLNTENLSVANKNITFILRQIICFVSLVFLLLHLLFTQYWLPESSKEILIWIYLFFRWQHIIDLYFWSSQMILYFFTISTEASWFKILFFRIRKVCFACLYENANLSFMVSRFLSLILWEFIQEVCNPHIYQV